MTSTTIPTTTNATAATVSKMNRVDPLAPNSAEITITASKNAHHHKYVFTTLRYRLFRGHS